MYLYNCAYSMFESKRIWQQEAQNDKTLSALNTTISTLQAMAKEANDRLKSGGENSKKYSVLVKTFMVLLKELRELSSKFLLDSSELSASEVSKQLEKFDIFISKLISKMPGFIFPDQEKEAEQLRQEKEEVEGLLKSSSDYSGRRFDSLLSILGEVRSYERTFAFQKRLRREKQLISESLDRSFDQFSYGTTRFSLWKSFLDHDSVKAIMQRSRLLSTESKVYVFGSSLGLLCYFTAVYYPNSYVVGYEVLSVLHEKATMLAREHHDVDNVEFQLEDMMKCDVSDADIVILTSLCWDEKTKNEVATKIASEAPLTCCVVSYDSDSFADFRMISSQNNRTVPEIETNSTLMNSSIDQLANYLEKALVFYSMYYYPYSVMNVDIRKERIMERRERAKYEKAEIESGSDDIHFSAQKPPFVLNDILSGSTSWSEEQRLYLYARSIDANSDYL